MPAVNAAPVVFLSAGILVAGFIVAGTEFYRTNGNEGDLQSFCKDRLSRCTNSEKGLKDCHESLLDLEFMETRIVTWRVEWAVSVFVASVSMVAAFAMGTSLGLGASLFLLTFLACMFGLRCMNSYKDCHILKHPKDARTRALRNLLGAPADTGHVYY